MLGLTLADGLTDADGLKLRLALADGLTDALGLILALTDAEGLTDALGLVVSTQSNARSANKLNAYGKLGLMLAEGLTL
jgi:hypothetical protein